jgi:hypothetical protein
MIIGSTHVEAIFTDMLPHCKLPLSQIYTSCSCRVRITYRYDVASCDQGSVKTELAG